MWYLCSLECAGVIQKLTVPELNGLVLSNSNTHVPVSVTWSILFLAFQFTKGKLVGDTFQCIQMCSFSLAIEPDISLYNVARRGLPVLCTTACYLPSLKPVTICTPGSGRSKLEVSVLLKDTTGDPHLVRTYDLGIMSLELCVSCDYKLSWNDAYTHARFQFLRHILKSVINGNESLQIKKKFKEST